MESNSDQEWGGR